MATEDLKDEKGELYPWGKFRSKESLGLDYELNGFLSMYGEGGYVLELGVESDPLEEITAKLQKLPKFLEFNTLAANFVVGGYILDIDYFFSVNLAIEKTPSGGY